MTRYCVVCKESSRICIFYSLPEFSPFLKIGLVYLNELESAQDMRELSVKQIKDILAMNRVNFKGVVEKAELLKILERLWKQEQRLKDGK